MIEYEMKNELQIFDGSMVFSVTHSTDLLFTKHETASFNREEDFDYIFFLVKFGFCFWECIHSLK